jgi:hypothetical protein
VTCDHANPPPEEPESAGEIIVRNSRTAELDTNTPSRCNALHRHEFIEAGVPRPRPRVADQPDVRNNSRWKLEDGNCELSLRSCPPARLVSAPERCRAVLRRPVPRACRSQSRADPAEVRRLDRGPRNRRANAPCSPRNASVQSRGHWMWPLASRRSDRHQSNGRRGPARLISNP